MPPLLILNFSKKKTSVIKCLEYTKFLMTFAVYASSSPPF